MICGLRNALFFSNGCMQPALAAVTVASTSTATAADTSTKLYNKASPMVPVTLGGAGLYAGAAGGVGWLHANQALSNVVASSFTTTGIDFNTFGTSTNTEAGSLTGRNPGAMASLFGYNYMLSSNGLIGAQLEGTLANTRVNLNGSSSSTFVDTSVFIPEGGAAETRTHTATGTFSGLSNTLDNRWLLSALARAGFLVDPGDLVYVIGGYTYGRFETFGTGFGMNGGTIGVGWERQIVQGWNIRGEYRYTRFSDATVSRAQTNTTTNAFGKFDETITSTFNTAGHFSDVDMHSVWLGVSHSFGP